MNILTGLLLKADLNSTFVTFCGDWWLVFLWFSILSFNLRDSLSTAHQISWCSMMALIENIENQCSHDALRCVQGECCSEPLLFTKSAVSHNIKSSHELFIFPDRLCSVDSDNGWIKQWCGWLSLDMHCEIIQGQRFCPQRTAVCHSAVV